MKKCSCCKKTISIDLFYRNKHKKDGRQGQCKKCHGLTAHKSRKYSKEQRRVEYLKHAIIPKSYLFRIYRHMSDRVKGLSSTKTSAKGKELLERDVFINWSIKNSEFKKLFYYYINNKRIRKYAPSIDRINNKLGYGLENIQWLTVSKNSLKYNLIERHNK